MKTPYLEHFQFFQRPHVGRRDRCHLNTNRSLRLIMIGEDHLHIIREGKVQEPCHTPYFDVTASRKHQYKPKTFCLKYRTQTI